MPLEAGSVEVRIGGNTDGLVAATREAKSVIDRFGRDARSSLDAAFSGHNLSPTLRQAIGSAVTDAQRTLERRVSGARDALARGLIDPQGFQRRAKEAGDAAAKELRDSFERLSQMGLLPPGVAERLSADLTDAARRAGEDAGRAAAQGMARGIQAAAPTLQRIGRTLTFGVTAPLTALGGVSVKAAADMEKLNLGLTAVAGSSEEAQTQLQRLERLARQPGLGFREAIRGSISLQAVGISAERSERALRGFGRAVALTGGGAAELDRIFVQLSQSASVGRILAADWRPIIQTAPAVSAAMREVFGTIDPQTIEAMGLTFEEFFDALVSRLEELPEVGGGAAKAFEEFADASFKLRAEIGNHLLPVLTPLVEQMAAAMESARDLSPEAVRMGIALGTSAAAIGPLVSGVTSLTSAFALLRIAGLATLPVIGATGGVAIGLSVLAGWFVKSKLDAAAARKEIEDYTESLRGLNTEAERTSALETLLERHAELRAALVVTPQEIAAPRGQYSPGFAKQVNPEWKRLSEEIETVNGQIAVLIGGIEGVGQATVTNLPKVTNSVSRLSDAIARFQAIRSLGVADIDAAPRSVQQAAESMVRLQREVAQVREDLATLGADAPPGALDYLSHLEERAAAAAAEAQRLAEVWTRGVAQMEAVSPSIVQSMAVSPFPSEAVVTADFERTMRNLREQFARGMIDREQFQAAGREAAEAYKRGLLEVIDSLRDRGQLSAELHAEITAKLTPLLDLEPVGREFNQTATDVTRGVVNVVDAFGELDERTRRAVTGLNEIAASLGQFKGGGIFQAANLGPLVGLAGGIAQSIAGVLDRSKYRETLHRNTTALKDLRAELSGFRVTGDVMDGVSAALEGIRRAGRIGIQHRGFGERELDRVLEQFGLTIDDLIRVGNEYGLSVVDNQGRIDWATLASEEFTLAMQEAVRTLTGFRNTLSDQQRRQRLDDDLYNRPTDAASGLANQFELLQRFMPEFVASLGDIDLSTEEGRKRLEEGIQALWEAFKAGTLDLEGLSRDEFLALVEGFAAAFDEFREAVDKTVASMSNVPPIFDLIARRRMAGEMPGWSMPAMPTSSGTATHHAESLSTTQIVINNPPPGMDTDRVAQEVIDALTRLDRRGGRNNFPVRAGAPLR